MFLTLLRKDWRLAKPAFVFMLALFLAPTILSFVMWAYARGISQAGYPLAGFFQNFQTTVLAGFAGSLLAVPAVAACQLGREKRERSADFVGAMPIPRYRIVASKLTVTSTIISIPALLVTFGAIVPWIALANMPSLEWPTLFWYLKLSLYTLLGVAGMGWLFSCLLASEIYATALSILVATTIGIGLSLAFNTLPSLRAIPPGLQESYFLFIISRLALWIGVISFAVGTLIALFRRTL
ncbi:MAG: hypothetical protein KF805_11150 [Phycisphaeraceae bacterium]|nr:hypothetical protein [Phycisphaeraceae bacterium]